MVICLAGQAQETPAKTFDNVSFYVTPSDVKVKRNSQYIPLTLLIDNQSKNTIHLTNFNKYILHKKDFSLDQRAFSWEFFTTSNHPADHLVINGFVPNNHLLGENIEVTISPGSTFISDIYIQASPSISYSEGYYKLCLYYENYNQCIAELLIKK